MKIRTCLLVAAIAAMGCGGGSGNVPVPDGATGQQCTPSASCLSCIKLSCDSQAKAAFGAGYQSGNFSGGACPNFVACTCNATGKGNVCAQADGANCVTAFAALSTCLDATACSDSTCKGSTTVVAVPQAGATPQQAGTTGSGSASVAGAGCADGSPWICSPGGCCGAGNTATPSTCCPNACCYGTLHCDYYTGLCGYSCMSPYGVDCDDGYCCPDLTTCAGGGKCRAGCPASIPIDCGNGTCCPRGFRCAGGGVCQATGNTGGTADCPYSCADLCNQSRASWVAQGCTQPFPDSTCAQMCSCTTTQCPCLMHCSLKCGNDATCASQCVKEKNVTSTACGGCNLTATAPCK